LSRTAPAASIVSRKPATDVAGCQSGKVESETVERDRNPTGQRSLGLEAGLFAGLTDQPARYDY
jgi:hypothetical protein